MVRFDGGLILYVLRQHDDHYLFVGQCYVDGAMLWQEESDDLYEQLSTALRRVFCLK